MSNRVEFKEPVKKALAKRAGNSCSFPGCISVTEGPNFESDTGVSKTGMACHIYAAATGPAARRVNSGITDEELIDISNGIWMCYTHGKLIDSDESTYTVDQLKTWREVAEIRAQLWQQFGRAVELSPEHFNKVPLPRSKIAFESFGQETYLIGEAIANSCMHQIWGEQESDAIRDALVELVRNTFEHGNARNIAIEITENTIRVVDDGSRYEAAMLLLEEKKGGGFHSINEISSNFGQSIYFTSYRESNKNFHVFSVLSSANDIKEITPCHVEISRDYYWGNEAEFKVAEYCKTVYVIFPKYFALSDALKLPILINKHLPKDKELVFVGERLSSLAVEIMHRELSELGRDDINIINF